jgi:hypothetical protein
MKIDRSKGLQAVLFAALCGPSATVLADPRVMLDQGGRIGPRQEAVLGCVNATRASIGDSKGLVFARRVEMEASGHEVKAITLNATIWEAGERVKIRARCVSDADGEVVATVTRPGAEAIAKVE